MKNPTIKHKVCSYDGRLWVIESVFTQPGGKTAMRLVDGDDTHVVTMGLTEYLKLNSSLEEQEFVILPPVVVPPVKPPPLPSVAKAFGLAGFVPPNAPKGFKGYK